VARPLREQFAIATLVLVVPVAAAVIWAAVPTYSEQLRQLGDESRLLAAAVAAHIDQAGPERDPGLDAFFARLGEPLQAGTEVSVTDATGRSVFRYVAPGAHTEETTAVSAVAASRRWTVTLAVPTAVAWERSRIVYRRTIAITGLATLFMLMIEAVVVRRWLGSFRHLARGAARVGDGDLRTPPSMSMPIRELEEVQAAFASMVERLRVAREEIAAQVEHERAMRDEVQLLQGQIIRQERLAAIGVLLSGIAHELNNPLQSIAGLSELLQRTGDPAPEVRADLALIRKESTRASAIIRNLSRFSRQQGVRPSIVFLSDIVASVVELRQRHLQEQSIDLDVDDQASHSLLAVHAELQQVLLNLVVNAEHALSSRPLGLRRIIIRTRDVGDRVRIELEDTGPGVPSEHESRLFQPFFTTKPVGEGTGLGLSVSYEIVRSLGGSIGYRRAEAGGALFSVELPGSEAATSSVIQAS
jgi:C4-dicarboxylate-specific signal transduction histidine kinase